MEHFEIQQTGFNTRAHHGGYVPALRKFEKLASEVAGARFDMNDPVFLEKYSLEEIQADIAATKKLSQKHFQGGDAEFRPSMLAEELVKIGGKFELFGKGATIQQTALYDDQRNNADALARVPLEAREQDGRFLRPIVNFVLDITTDKGERLAEKNNKLIAELRSGKLTDVKYYPGIGRGLSGVPRFVLEIDEEELVSFFEKAKTSLDGASGINMRGFATHYEFFSHDVCKKIISSAREQIVYLLECAGKATLADEIIDRAAELTEMTPNGFYKALEYIDGVNADRLKITGEDNKITVPLYLAMVKKLLMVGVAVERVLETKEKRVSTQQASETLH